MGGGFAALRLTIVVIVFIPALLGALLGASVHRHIRIVFLFINRVVRCGTYCYVRKDVSICDALRALFYVLSSFRTQHCRAVTLDISSLHKSSYRRSTNNYEGWHESELAQVKPAFV